MSRTLELHLRQTFGATAMRPHRGSWCSLYLPTNRCPPSGDQLTAPKQPDIWWEIDRPMLMESAAELHANPEAYPSARMTASRLGIDPEQGAAAIRRLADAGFIETSGGWEPDVMGLKERGYREVGWWPDGDAALDRLLAELDKRIEHATGDDRSRLVKMRDATVGLGRDVGVQLLGAYLGLQIGG